MVGARGLSETQGARERDRHNIARVSDTAKTATKTAKPSPRSGVRLPLGAHPGNTGGKKGRSGRKPEAFTSFLTKLRQNPALHQALERAVTDETSPGFRSALKVLTDYDTEKPAEKKELSGKLEVTVRVAREGRRITAG